MKIVIAFLSIAALLGIVYGLAFFGIIPVQKMAAKSPALASTLVKLHLAKAKKAKPATLTSAVPDPAQAALDTQKKQLAADRAQLDKDRAAFEAQKQQPTPTAASDSAAPDMGADPAATDNAAKLSAIYAAMSPDDLARIFGKLPDPDVIGSLTQLDEKKAGQILAILPADRAARIARQMSHSTPTNTADASVFVRGPTLQ